MLNVRNELINICKSLGDVQIIYDCGSRDALDGIELLRKLEAKELHVFECNPAGIALCRKNINNYEGDASIFLNEVAISDVDGEMDFNSIDPGKTITPHPDGNIGASSLLKPDGLYPNEQYATTSVRVKSTTLDTYAESHSTPDLLWMDLQGAELMALKGASHMLNSIKFIYVEVTFRQMYVGQPLFHSIHRHLKKHFNLYRLFDVSKKEEFIRTYLHRYSIWKNRGMWFTDALYVNKNIKMR